MRYLVTLVMLFGLSGCCGVPKEALEQANTSSVLCDTFIGLMDGGNTTREQEKEFIRANRKAWHAQNFALNEVPLPEDLR